MTMPTKIAAPTMTLERFRRQVDAALRRLLQAHTPSRILTQGMRYCVLSEGKRFRPLLTLGACEAVGAPARQALSVACAVELIHTYSLVHDDLPAMDDAAERRGRPSCHRKFGEANAILVGDALLTLAFELLSRNGMPNGMRIIQTIGRASGTTGLIGGQVLDLEAMQRPRSTTPRMLSRIAERKTAALIRASIAAGALAGGATAAQLQRLDRFGQEMGLAFQLLDDVHDREGLAEAFGVEGARTRAQRLIQRGSDHLKPFGARAGVLRDLAAWLAGS